jgi:hypothetical protein
MCRDLIKERIGLYIWSSFAFVLMALLIRVAGIIYTHILLKFFSISFVFTPFGIKYGTFGNSTWSVNRVYLVFGTLPLMLFFLGILITLLIRYNVFQKWKGRVVAIWLAFLLINQLPAGIIAGTFIFDEVGFVYFNLVNDLSKRILISGGLLIVMILFRPVWVWNFLKSAPNRSIISGSNNKRLYIRSVFILPYFTGLIILLVFGITWGYWVWVIQMGLMSFLVLPLFIRLIPELSPRIRKSQNVLMLSKTRIFVVLLMLVGIYALSFLHIPVT